MEMLTAPKRKIEYPTEDGKPMAETDKHANLMNYLRESLRVFFADRPDVYVSGNNFVFWEEGNPKARISPDVYAVFGAGMRLRDSYLAWKEGGLLPDVVFEITSRKTQREDVETKLPLYQDVLKTPEYFLFDPTGDYLKPRLQGYRLAQGRYVRMELTGGRLHSEQLGLDLVQEGDTLRLYDPIKGAFLPTTLELTRQRDEEAHRAALALAENAQLRAELARLRGESNQ